jgi:hypothetical protein
MSFAALLAAADRAVITIAGGEAVTYASDTFSGAPSVIITGLFSSPDVHVTVEGASVQSDGPSVFIRLTDLGTLNPDSDANPTVTVSGATYSVRDVVKDGEGGALLKLTERDS